MTTTYSIFNDLRLIRFRLWELGADIDPPPCYANTYGTAEGCWCYIEPAATMKDGKLSPRRCPPKPQLPPPPVIIIVGPDEED